MEASDEIGLMWFRRDLRLDDNPAWAAATSERKYVVPLYVIDPHLIDGVGPYRRRQLIANLQALDYELAERMGGRLMVRFGDPVRLVPEAASVFGAGGAYWNTDVSAWARRRDGQVSDALSIPVSTWYGSLVLAPGAVLTKRGAVSRVFNPFFKAWKQAPWDSWPEPGEPVVLDDPGEFVPRLDEPPPRFEGPDEARRRLELFLTRVDRYDTDRDRLDRDGTSLLSSDLRFGTLSPRQVVQKVGDATEGRRAFIRQLAWRDWYAHLLVEIPNLSSRSFNDRLEGITWRNDPADVAAWKGGFTGYPIVDAAMRELRQTGWMHYRARTVVSSFLVKDLMVDWRIGERHFRYLLVDFDVAQNAGNWQCVAGTGPDAAPLMRVINPVAQSRKFDPDGNYIRLWVPELAKLSSDVIHEPWEAMPDELANAGVVLGVDYPAPIVDHDEARMRFLAASGAAENLSRAPAIEDGDEDQDDGDGDGDGASDVGGRGISDERSA